MAAITTLAAYPLYYTIRVEFLGQSFDQTIISSNTGAELTAQLQSYADQYESDWAMMQPPPQET
jgi:hypothetical protein